MYCHLPVSLASVSVKQADVVDRRHFKKGSIPEIITLCLHHIHVQCSSNKSKSGYLLLNVSYLHFSVSQKHLIYK